MGILDWISEKAKAQYAKGAPYREAVGGLLQGDMNKVNQALSKSDLTPMDFALMMGTSGIGGKLPKTEFEVAHELAQQRAALPVSEGGLGLPANNTAMDRAKAMGYTTPAYHGTGNKFNEFDVNTIGNNFPQSEGGGFFFSQNPKSANSYAILSNGKNKNIMPVYLKSENQLTKNVNSEYINPIEYYDMQNGWLPSEAKLQNKNILIKGTKNDDLNVIFNPSDIRSRFAAFDPFRRNEADILAGVAAAPVGLLAIDKEKKKKK